MAGLWNIEVLDKDGHELAKLKITGRDIERWLLIADVKPDKSDDAKPAEGGGSGDKK